MNKEEILEMSEKERDRLVILRQVEEKLISQVKAAKLLKISDRHVRNLLKTLKTEGAKGLISKRRGQPSNHSLPKELKAQAIDKLKNELEGFGPTFAAEKLLELWSIKVSHESLRLWMIEEGLWKPNVKKKKVHKPRERRACFGELIQADGSHHRWFGPDKPMVNLTVMIDDATGKLTGLHFSKEETLIAYFRTLEQHITRYGRPRALYTDRSAVCEVRQGSSITQFHRALNSLSIELILANSPQAKGRVERANRTLQDRLLKELKLRGINDIDEANKFLPEFIKQYNEKFSREPINTVDTHRPLEGHDLSTILTRHETRTLIANCIFQYNNVFFEVKDLAKTRKNKGRKVHLFIDSTGSFRAFVDGVERNIKQCKALEKPQRPNVKSRKDLRSWKPKKSHPWKQWKPGCFGKDHAA